tara:strand:+ start:3678 stop:4238 length:561 start_codon:yes stop_codon:yes gene_type:complete
MENTFTKLKENENAEFLKSEKKWWNGHAYLPLKNYHLNYKYLNGKIIIHYEFRQSEFSKPSMIDGGAFGDRHNCQVKCKIEIDKSFLNFSISERGILAKLFNRKPDLNYVIKCNNENLKNFLKRNQNLKDIFTIVENSPEFSPLIEAKMKNGNYELNIMYNTQQKNENALNSINEFCKNLIDYCNR